jgi:hypothetical protein
MKKHYGILILSPAPPPIFRQRWRCIKGAGGSDEFRDLSNAFITMAGNLARLMAVKASASPHRTCPVCSTSFIAPILRDRGKPAAMGWD